MNTFLNEYNNLITEYITHDYNSKQIIDSLYHQEFIKYLRFGIHPRIDEINNTAQNIFETQNSNTFDFVSAVQNGRTLFIGEGNFSFSLSIVKQVGDVSNIIASTIEKEDDFSDFTKSNILALESLGVQVLCGIDATQIAKQFEGYIFDNIIFQFPHTGSFKSVDGENPNFTLLRDFLISAKPLLSADGKVIVSIVNSPFYQRIFKIEEVAKITGYNDVQIYDFNSLLFADYNHKMTNKEESTISSEDDLITIVFQV
jgi:hypothetical protein